MQHLGLLPELFPPSVTSLHLCEGAGARLGLASAGNHRSQNQIPSFRVNGAGKNNRAIVSDVTAQFEMLAGLRPGDMHGMKASGIGEVGRASEQAGFAVEIEDDLHRQAIRGAHHGGVRANGNSRPIAAPGPHVSTGRGAGTGGRHHLIGAASGIARAGDRSRDADSLRAGLRKGAGDSGAGDGSTQRPRRRARASQSNASRESAHGLGESPGNGGGAAGRGNVGEIPGPRQSLS